MNFNFDCFTRIEDFDKNAKQCCQILCETLRGNKHHLAIYWDVDHPILEHTHEKSHENYEMKGRFIMPKDIVTMQSVFTALGLSDHNIEWIVRERDDGEDNIYDEVMQCHLSDIAPSQFDIYEKDLASGCIG
jgi:hypothetical protein